MVDDERIDLLPFEHVPSSHVTDGEVHMSDLARNSGLLIKNKTRVESVLKNEGAFG